MAEQIDNELAEKKAHPFKTFLYIVLIPLLFAVIVSLIVAQAAGINVLDKAKSIGQKIPLAGSLLHKNAPAKNGQNTVKDLQELKAEVKDRDKQIADLNAKLDNQNKDLLKAQMENNQLQQQIDNLKAAQKKTSVTLKDIVTTYETMSPKKAAPIIAKMSDTEALQILTSVKADVRASIMENMDPAQAARFTELMANQNAANQ